MEITCKNCNQKFEGNYCNNCGQTAETCRINFRFLWHEIRHSLLHYDQGILYSIKQLFTRPGHSIREFIEGKRVKHFKPISLVVLIAAIYGYLFHHYNINFEDHNLQTSAESEVTLDNIMEWINNHFSWTTLLTIPLFTIGTSIVFRKQNYNFVEYFILNTFKASQRLIVAIILFPLIYYYNGTKELAVIYSLIYIIDIAIIFWTNEQFFNKLSLKKTFFLTLLSQLIFLSCLFLVLGTIAVISELVTE